MLNVYVTRASRRRRRHHHRRRRSRRRSESINSTCTAAGHWNITPSLRRNMTECFLTFLRKRITPR